MLNLGTKFSDEFTYFVDSRRKIDSFFIDHVLGDSCEALSGGINWAVRIDEDRCHFKDLELLYTANGPVKVYKSWNFIAMLRVN